MRSTSRRAWFAVVAGLMLGQIASAAYRVDVLQSIGGLPPHIAGTFTEPLAFQQIKSGKYYVFDRRAHSVFVVDAAKTVATRIVSIGHEEGRIIEPSAFDADAEGTFVIADAPGGHERVQLFAPGGSRLGGFDLPGRAMPRVTLGGLTLSGAGSLRYTGRLLVMSQPETGSLITEYTLSGRPTRSIGHLRYTGQEQNRDVHLALNSGFPVPISGGGFYFVFQSGEPLFQKYDAAGRLLFERHIEGSELDDLVRGLPTTWLRRTDAATGGRELPLVVPNVVAANADRDGGLWVVFKLPYTYVYDAAGDKVRVVQFRAAGLISPTSLSFTPEGRILVTPGCYEFDPRGPRAGAR